jgi:hypothetical protein
MHDEKPIDLFDYSDLDKSYKALIKKYHPDHGGSEDDFIYLKSCYEKAKFEIETGQAIGKDCIYFFEPNKKREIKYSSLTEFSYGTVYVGKKYLAYEFSSDKVEEEFCDIYTSFEFFENDKMKETFNDQLPTKEIEKIAIKKDGALVKQFIIIEKSPNAYLLSDVIKHNIPLETSIWIFNRLYGLGCYMCLPINMNGIYHLDIAPYNITVDLENHSLQLLGGWWWYAPGYTGKLSRMPLRTYNLLTNKMKETKTASIEIITEQIKDVMREILDGRDIPRVYSSWLSLPAQENIVEEYSQWEHEVMPKIFPVRKFYKWTI